jgi:hypothetical protein
LACKAIDVDPYNPDIYHPLADLYRALLLLAGLFEQSEAESIEGGISTRRHHITRLAGPVFGQTI